MLIEFFIKLKEGAVPVSIREFLTLLEALHKEVAYGNVEDFYYLARTCLVKDEKYFDRFDQAEAAAQTAGPGLGGLLVGVVGAPLAIAVDAVTYLIDAVLIAGMRLEERLSRSAAPRSVRREMVEGLIAMRLER